MNNGLIKSFEDSLLGNFIDPTTDLVEVAVDSLFEDGIIKDIPIVKYIYSVGKTIVCIRDKYLCKRLIAFIQEFNQNNISKEQLQKHINELCDNNRLQFEYEKVILYIDLCTEEVQSKYIARFYIAYLNREINWETFTELAEANRRMFINDYSVLRYIASQKYVDSVNEDEESAVSRLASLGLLSDTRLNTITGGFLVTEDCKREPIKILNLGAIFSNYIDK